jgi:predicted amidohydrolase YtcJ
VAVTRKCGRIALDSNFPIESINPLKGFHTTATRLSEAGTSPHGPEGWNATMRLSRQEALTGMTIDGEFTYIYPDPDPDRL